MAESRPEACECETLLQTHTWWENSTGQPGHRDTAGGADRGRMRVGELLLYGLC